MAQNRPEPLERSDLPWLTVITVNYNGWPDSTRLASDLARSHEVTSGQCELIVVDNASDGPIPAFFLDPPSGVRLIVRPNNGGFAAGVNAGWRASRSRWILLLNPDVEEFPGFLTSVLARIAFHEARPDGPPGIVGFALQNPDGSPQPSVGAEVGLSRALFAQFLPRSRRSYHPSPSPGPVPWVTGACFLIDGSLMDTLGGMDEDFFLYYEEVALCRSVRKLGRRVEYDDRVSVVHLRPLQNRALAARMRVIVRHAKLLFFLKHQPRWQFLALALMVSCESVVRGLGAKFAGNRAEIGAWRAIGSMAWGMLRGRVLKGREVLALADSATNTQRSARNRFRSRPHVFELQPDEAEARRPSG